MNALSLLSPALLVCAAAPVLAHVVVASPHHASKVVSPFWLSAKAEPCSSQSIAATGYSIDNSTNTTVFHGASVNAHVQAGTGTHTLHVKSWGVSGASCVSDVVIRVVPSPVASVPAGASVTREIQSWNGWHAVHDNGTGNGRSTGVMDMISALSLSGSARRFVTNFSNSAGERYYVTFGNDSAPKNFLYDTWVYIAGSSGDIANLELDLNQVIGNGDTVIFGIQCDGYSYTWDYTVNEGSRKNYIDAWRHSNAWCNPREWSTNTWHHVQISYSRNNAGHVTYKSIWLDGVQEDIDVKVPSAFSLGWGNALLTNFQVDGLGGYGSVTMFADHMTVYRW